MDDMMAKKHRIFLHRVRLIFSKCYQEARWLDFFSTVTTASGNNYFLFSPWIGMCLPSAGQFKSSFNLATLLIVGRKDTDHNSA